MSMMQKGHAITIPGTNLNADTAMGWYLGMDGLPPEEIASQFMAGIDPEIAKLTKNGDILVCGKNFGYGKVHQALYTAMRVLDLKCIVAESFSTQLIQSAMNGNVFLVEIPDILNSVKMGDEIEVDVETATLTNLTQNKVIKGKPFPPFMLEVMKSGGQMAYLARKVMMRKQQQG